jgi:hypothetical protein
MMTPEALRAKLGELLQSWIQDGDAQEQKKTGEFLVEPWTRIVSRIVLCSRLSSRV